MTRAARRLELIAAAAQTACLMDVMAPKPGNVERGRDLPGLTYRDFVLSAYAIGPAFRRHARGRTGRLILEAIRTTRRHVATRKRHVRPHKCQMGITKSRTGQNWYDFRPSVTRFPGGAA